MGRPRKHNLHLPPRVYPKHGAFYYEMPGTREWIRLGETLSECHAAYAKLISVSPTLPNMNKVFDRFIVEKLPLLAERTQKDYIGYIAQHLRPFFGDAPPRQVLPRHVVAFQSKYKVKSYTQTNKMIACLSSVFRSALEWQAVDSNPCHQVRRLTEVPRDRYVIDWELAIVYKHANDMLRAGIDIVRLIGIRKGDLLRLGPENLDMSEEGGITWDLGKSRRKIMKRGKIVETVKTAPVSWSPELRQVIENLQAQSPRTRLTLLCTQSGAPFTESGWDSLFRRAMDKALADGLKESFTFHDIRAKNSSDDEDEAVASQRLAHADPRTTRRTYRRKPTKTRPLQ